MIELPDRFNDIGKVKLNLSDIDLNIDWDVSPSKILSVQLSEESIKRVEEQTLGKEAVVYLDVTKGYNRQRFNCGTNQNLHQLNALCTENNSNLLLTAFKPNAKFEINIVCTHEKTLFRRSPSIYTTDGDLMEMFYVVKDDTLGELPYVVEPPMREGTSSCTIKVSSQCFTQFDKAITSELTISNLIKLDAFKNSISHICREYIEDDSALEHESFLPWIVFIEDVLHLSPPKTSDNDEVTQWRQDVIKEFSRYYTLSSSINNGLRLLFGGE